MAETTFAQILLAVEGLRPYVRQGIFLAYGREMISEENQTMLTLLQAAARGQLTRSDVSHLLEFNPALLGHEDLGQLLGRLPIPFEDVVKIVEAVPVPVRGFGLAPWARESTEAEWNQFMAEVSATREATRRLKATFRSRWLSFMASCRRAWAAFLQDDDDD